MGRYGKAVAAVVVAALTVLYAAISGDDRIDAEEWVQVAIAVTSAAGVYLVPIAPQMRWGKTAVAALLAGLQILATVILGGLDSGEWMVIALAVLGALGVGRADSVSDNGISSKNPVSNKPDAGPPPAL